MNLYSSARDPLRLPEGLEDVSKVPKVVAELLRRGWTDEEVNAALGNNLLRVLSQAEKVRHRLNKYNVCNLAWKQLYKSHFYQFIVLTPRHRLP